MRPQNRRAVVLAVRFCSFHFAAGRFKLPTPSEVPFWLRAHCPQRSNCVVKKSPGLHPAQKGGIKRTMEIALPLEQMTVAEKLRMMETLWSDLTRTQERFESPEWHGEVLRERAARVEQGKESFMDWETAKSQLRNRVK